MKKISVLILVGVLALGFSSGSVFAEVNAVTPSTNDINQTNGWAHVNQLSMGVGTTDLEFISTRGFASCFEYRTDGDVSQKIDDTNHNNDITDGLYPYYCQNNNFSTHAITANEYVEVRMVFGAEKDERFDWTRFDVLPAPLTAPKITGFLDPSLSCGAITNIHSTTVDWTDSTGGVGGVIGYQYAINYPLLDGSGQGNWTTFIVPSQYTGSLNEGVHTVKVRAKDSAGNYSDWSNECTITTDWTSPLVTIENPEEGDMVFGIVDIYGTVEEETRLNHYNISIYKGDANFNDFSQRLEQKTEYLSDGFNDQSIYQWDTTGYDDGEYLIRLAARDKAGNRDLSGNAWLGGDDSQHVIKVVVKNTPDPIGPPTDKSECMKGGWMEFDNPSFRNQGDCISYIQSNPNAKGNRKDN
jgi:hypothetical protein